jgi:hypothetical protein
MRVWYSIDGGCSYAIGQVQVEALFTVTGKVFRGLRTEEWT